MSRGLSSRSAPAGHSGCPPWSRPEHADGRFQRLPGRSRGLHGLSLGDLYVAHALANAAGKNFNDLVKLKKQGQTWDKIADDNNVSLGGKKVKKMANTTATPTPRPMRNPSSQPTPDQSSSYKMPMP